MKAALVFAALLLCCSGVNAEPVDLVGCSKKTCVQIESGPHFHTVGSVTAVTGIADSNTCPGKCTVVDSPAGRMHILGNYLDIECKAWGGNDCLHKPKAGK